jgi:hypothetical protein
MLIGDGAAEGPARDKEQKPAEGTNPLPFDLMQTSARLLFSGSYLKLYTTAARLKVIDITGRPQLTLFAS